VQTSVRPLVQQDDSKLRKLFTLGPLKNAGRQREKRGAKMNQCPLHKWIKKHCWSGTAKAGERLPRTPERKKTSSKLFMGSFKTQSMPVWNVHRGLFKGDVPHHREPPQKITLFTRKKARKRSHGPATKSSSDRLELSKHQLWGNGTGTHADSA